MKNDLLKHVKLKYETMHDPGHSGLGSTVVVVAGGWWGLGRGLAVDVIALVLSQHTEPLLQFEVRGIRTEGLSQKAAMMFKRQRPGHLGRVSCVVVLSVVLVVIGAGLLSSSGWKMLRVKKNGQGVIKNRRIEEITVVREIRFVGSGFEDN